MTIRGIIRGKTIELETEPGLPDGQAVAVEVRPVLRLCATFDHRIIDGAHAGKLAAEIRELLSNPEKLCEPAADTPTVKTLPAPA